MDFIKEVKEPLCPRSLYRISADFQTQGRGQHSRSFMGISKKSLLCSFVFALDNKNTPASALFIEIAALKLCLILKELGISPLIKWPNDILINGNKIGGFLGEISQKQDASWFCLGVGLNVNFTKEDSALINDTTTSILLETKKSMEVAPIQEKLDLAIFTALNLFFSKGFAPFYDDFNAFFSLTNKQTQGIYQGKEIKGLCLGMNSGGMMMLGNKDTTNLLNPAFIEKLEKVHN